MIRALPDDPALRPSACIEVEVTDAPLPPLRATVERMLPLPVRVRRANGTPIAGTRVELVLPGSWPVRAETGFFAAERDGSRLQQRGFLPSLLLSSASTDAAGECRLHAPAVAVTLRAAGPGHRPFLQPGVLATPGMAPIELIAPAGARLEGQLLAPPGGLTDACLRLCYDRNANHYEPRRGGIEVAADGRFAIDELPAGTAQLVLTMFARNAGASGGGTSAVDFPLAKLDLAAGATRTVVADARHLRRSTLNARVLLDEAPAERARLVLQGTETYERGSSSWYHGEYVPDANGAVCATDLVPGRYRAFLKVGDFRAREGDHVWLPESFEIAPGAELSKVLGFVRRRLRLRLVDADGETPLRDMACYVSATYPSERRTDSEGWLVLDPAPADPVHVQVQRQPPVVLGPVTMPQDRKEAIFELRMPGR